jgi:opacity protein-like surface antigen
MGLAQRLNGLRVPVWGPAYIQEVVFMKKVLSLICFILVAAIPIRAQDEYPKVEIFGGYSYLSAGIRFDDPFDDDAAGFFDEREGVHGFGFNIAGNFHRNVGIVADFSYHKRELEAPFGDDVDFSTFNFLFGPRFTARGDRVDGFVHTLIGGVRRKVEDFDSDTELAFGLGGGVDVKVTPNFGIRVIQLDYIPVRSRDIFTLDKDWDHNLRAQVGLTFKWQ